MGVRSEVIGWTKERTFLCNLIFQVVSSKYGERVEFGFSASVAEPLTPEVRPLNGKSEQILQLSLLPSLTGDAIPCFDQGQFGNCCKYRAWTAV